MRMYLTTCMHAQVRTIILPRDGPLAVPIQSDNLSAKDLSLIFETVARSVSIQTQDISLHLWALTSAAAPKRMRSNVAEVRRDSRAVGELLKTILGLSGAERLHATFEAKYMLQEPTT